MGGGHGKGWEVPRCHSHSLPHMLALCRPFSCPSLIYPPTLPPHPPTCMLRAMRFTYAGQSRVCGLETTITRGDGRRERGACTGAVWL